MLLAFLAQSSEALWQSFWYGFTHGRYTFPGNTIRIIMLGSVAALVESERVLRTMAWPTVLKRVFTGEDAWFANVAQWLMVPTLTHGLCIPSLGVLAAAWMSYFVSILMTASPRRRMSEARTDGNILFLLFIGFVLYIWTVRAVFNAAGGDLRDPDWAPVSIGLHGKRCTGVDVLRNADVLRNIK